MIRILLSDDAKTVVTVAGDYVQTCGPGLVVWVAKSEKRMRKKGFWGHELYDHNMDEAVAAFASGSWFYWEKTP